MKNLLACIILVALYSCSKDDLPKTVPSCQAVTYYMDSYDTRWALVKTEVSYHMCTVCDADLERFTTYEPLTQICGENKLLRLVIGKDSCQSALK
jgi:ethanolamine utilization protein EutP (predicted NTPase)